MSGFTSCKSVQCEFKIMILSNFYVLVQSLENCLSYNLVGYASHDNSLACAHLYLCTFLLNWIKKMVEITINNIAIKFEEWIEWVGVTIGCVITRISLYILVGATPVSIGTCT